MKIIFVTTIPPRKINLIEGEVQQDSFSYEN